VPLALNGDAGARGDMVSTFFKRVAKHFANEVAVVTPNGRLLSHDPAEGLARWKKLPRAERKRLADLGRYDTRLDPSPPPGGLVLKVYARALTRGPGGRLGAYKTGVARSREPGRDHLWLSAGEWKALVPEAPRPGQRRPVPAALADRLCRRCLIDLVRVGGNGGPRRPDEVLARELRLTAEEVTPARLRLRLDGRARLATHDVGCGARGKAPKVDTFALLGYLDYDRAKKVVTRFDVVALSETGHYDEVHRKVLPLGVAFELTRADSPADRVPPSSFGKDYFGKGG
jgi:hypothetical protein